MVNLGLNAKSKGNMSTSLHMMYEAHMLVRSRLLIDGDDQTLLKEQFSKSCLDLGDVLAEVNCDGECHQTIAYYLMSGLSLQNMVKHVSKKPFCKGLLEYFQYLLAHIDNVTDLLSEEELDSIFYIYPELVAELFLKSALNNYPLRKIENFLIKTTASEENKNSIARFASGIFDIIYGHSDYDDDPFSGLTGDCIINLGVTYNSWLHEDYKKLSVVGEKLLKYHLSVLTEIVLQLFRNQEYTLDVILNFFNSPGSFENMSLLAQFFETLLAEVTLNLFYEDYAKLLINIYLRELKHQHLQIRITTSHKHYPEGHGLFQTRFTWLNHMKPFRGTDPKFEPCLKLITTKVKDISCSCCCCNSIIIKLQSLLCYKLDITLFNIVQDYLKSEEMVCCESLQAIIDHHFKQSDMIKNLFSTNLPCLVVYIQEIKSLPCSTWLNLFKTVLDNLDHDSAKMDSIQHQMLLLCAATLSEETIISLFKDRQKLLPYLKICLQQKMATELEDDIQQQCKEHLRGFYGI